MNERQLGGALVIAFDEMAKSRQRVTLIEKKSRDNAYKLRSDLSALQEDVRRRLVVVEREHPFLSDAVERLSKAVQSGQYSLDESFGMINALTVELKRVELFGGVLRSLLGDIETRLTKEVGEAKDAAKDVDSRLTGCMDQMAKEMSGMCSSDDLEAARDKLRERMHKAEEATKTLSGKVVDDLKVRDGKLVVHWLNGKEKELALPKPKGFGAAGSFGSGGASSEWRQNVIRVTTDYTVQAIDLSSVSKLVVLADATAGNLTVTIPKSAPYPHMVINVKRMNTNANTVTVNSTDLIEGMTDRVINVSKYAIEMTPFASLGWVET